MAHGYARRRKREPRVAEIVRQCLRALVVLQIPRGVKVVDRAVELGRDPRVALACAARGHGRARDGTRRNTTALEQIDIRIGNAAADGLSLAEGGIGRLVIRLPPGVGDVREQPVVEIQHALVVLRRGGGKQTVCRLRKLRAARRAVIRIDPVERDGDVRIHPAVHRVAVRAHPELRIVEQLAQTGGERVGVAAIDDRIRLLAHRRVQHGGDARVRAAVRRSVRQDG